MKIKNVNRTGSNSSDPFLSSGLLTRRWQLGSALNAAPTILRRKACLISGRSEAGSKLWTRERLIAKSWIPWQLCILISLKSFFFFMNRRYLTHSPLSRETEGWCRGLYLGTKSSVFPRRTTLGVWASSLHLCIYHAPQPPYRQRVAADSCGMRP